MVADSPKKLKVAEKNENTEETDEEILHSIEMLQDIQDELEKINEKASDEVLQVEQKYNEIRKPFYDKRNEIIKYIPDFWTKAFFSHPALNELLNEDDEKIFKYFISIEVEDFKDVKSGYSITFNFEPNPFFEDTKLTKTFTFPDEGTTKISATAIKWNKQMGIPNGVSNDKTGKKRAHENMSFFSWFSDSEQKEGIAEFHDEVAEVIKEDLWLNPLAYFNNEVGEDDFDEEDEEGKDEDDSEEDEEEDDQDDEDEDEGNEEEGK